MSNTENFDFLDEDGLSPLYRSVKTRNSNVMEALIQNNASVCHAIKSSISPISWAIDLNMASDLEYMVKSGLAPQARGVFLLSSVHQRKLASTVILAENALDV